MKLENQFLVFVIDDDPEIQVLFRKFFKLENYSVEVFSSARVALEKLTEECKLIICDLKLPDLDGLAFLDKVRERKYNVPILFITAHGSVETAVEALRKGAFDYLVKPVHFSELSSVALRAIQQSQLADERVTTIDPFLAVIGKSRGICQIFSLIERVSRSNSSVLITGESGTGKEVVARLIHKKSARCNFPFIAINCSAIPDQLLESELFGHKRGAFTGADQSRRGLFEEAQNGTLFLDEIGDMPINLQVKLLRVLQEKKVKPLGENYARDIDVRIISATHKNLTTLIQEKKFREDLYYRLCVIHIHVPPLRERREDILELAEFFLKKICLENQTGKKIFTSAAKRKLVESSWFGNVRELENVIERAVVLSEQPSIGDEEIETSCEEHMSAFLPGIYPKLLTLQDLEKAYIEHVLQLTHGAKEKASEILGINRKTLYRKEVEYGLFEK